MNKNQSRSIFKPPFTVTKLLVWIIIVLVAGLLFVGGRFLYYGFLDPVAAFDVSSGGEIKTVPNANPQVVLDESGALIADDNLDVAVQISEDEKLLSQADLDFIKNKVNILLIGADISKERLGTDRLDYRSDVLMLLTFDFENKKVDMISVPRDSLAPIYNTKGRWKINAAFAHGGGYNEQGPDYAMKTISNLLGGIPINYYAGVDMNALRDIVNAIGGIDYDVDVPITLNGRKLEKGFQHLDGQQVLDYCRARKGISTDVGRNDRQQRILMTIFEQLKEKDQLLMIPKVYEAMKDKVFTNLSVEQIVALAVFGKEVGLNNISRHTLDGKYMNVYDASFYILDMLKKEELVRSVFGIDINSDMNYDLKYVEADAAIEKAVKTANSIMEKNAGLISTDRMNELVELVTLAGTAKAEHDIKNKLLRAEELTALTDQIQLEINSYVPEIDIYTPIEEGF